MATESWCNGIYGKEPASGEGSSHGRLSSVANDQRSFTIPAPTPSALCPLESAIVYASHTAYLLELDQDRTTPFTASVRPVHTIISSSHKLSESFSFLTAAESDRHISVFNSKSGGSVGDLRTDDDVVSMALYTKDIPALEPSDMQVVPQPQQVLLVVNREGALEIFPSPFAIGNAARRPTSDPLKSRMKQRTRKAAAVVKIIRPDKASTPVPVLDASFQENEIVMVWTEGGVNLIFDRLKIFDEEDGTLLMDGLTEIVKAKSGSSVGAVVMNGVKDIGRSHVDESHAVVVNGGDRVEKFSAADEREVIDISSGEEESESEDGSMAEEVAAESAAGDEDVQMQEGNDEDEDTVENPIRNEPSRVEGPATEVGNVAVLDEPEEPSFGDLIRVNAPEPIDVQATFRDPHEQAVAPIHEGAANLPSGMSLGTVLAQSLRTNDVNLLETCFHVKSLPMVRATIERLDSALAAALLQKLAERLHSRPGRAGSLMVWIQWTLVAHGGYIANQPEVMKQLASLYRVVQERANGLQPLLALKGKLDMLEAQMNLRKRLQARSKARHGIDEEDDERVVYVEGQEESDSEAERTKINSPRQALIRQATDGNEPGSSGESEDEDEDDEDDEDAEDEMQMTTNGVEPGASSEESDSDEADFIDDEASSTDQDSDDGASLDGTDHESVDTSESNASSPPQSPPPKVSAGPKLSNGVGPRQRGKPRG